MHDPGKDKELTANGEFSEQLNDDEKILFAELDLFGESRRQFLGKITVGGVTALTAGKLGEQTIYAAPNASDNEFGNGILTDAPLENAVKVAFKVNGSEKSLSVDSRMTLLDALREKLDLTGSKKGCDHGQCGACTVIVDGRRVLSCLTLTATCEGKSVTTIEGLAKSGELHPVQAAFVKHDGFQCGYCTPGQICSAVALLSEAKNGEASYVTSDVRAKTGAVKLSDDEIRERMSGNICRCGAYPNIVDAIREVHSGKNVAQNWQFAGDDDQAIFENVENFKEGEAINETV